VLRFPITHWRGFLGSLFVLALFLTLPVWLLVDNYVDAAGIQVIPSPAMNLSPPKDGYFGNPVEVYSSEENGYASDFCVTFEFVGLDEATSYTDFEILIGATEQGKQQLKDLASSHKSGQLVFMSNSGLSNFARTFSLSALEGAPATSCGSDNAGISPALLDRNAGVRLRQQIFTLGTPRAFPNDAYELNDLVTVSVPAAGQELYSSLIMTSRDEDFKLTAGIYDPSNHDAASNRLMFVIRRPVLMIWYTYWVAAMPFVLLIGIFGIRYFPMRGLSGGKVPEAHEVAFGVAATLVAILPLHTVLVPNSLPSPTRLDIYFGIGITLLVAVSILWITGTSKRLRDSGHPPAESGHVGMPQSPSGRDGHS
jgi:hypothetical protein